MKRDGFIIDTHLLRELGDLLVGRDSTAVLELIKNGYDADATYVRIDAQNLANPDLAVLSVEDDGNGMTANRFRTAFLRIAGREKEMGNRTSPRFTRAYTGQKGIGRLASQKLARQLEVFSTPRLDRVTPSLGVHATIDWEDIDRQERLDQLTSGLLVDDVATTGNTKSGTTLILRRLKREWSAKDVATFVNELQSAQPPQFLLNADAERLGIEGETLLGEPRVRTTGKQDPGFTLQLTGDVEAGDDLWETAATDFHWCIEIDVADGRARYRITPTRAYAAADPFARSYSFQTRTSDSLTLQARFYMMLNASARRGPLSGFVRSKSGIRVYMEGFRVLPYGEYGDDWLEIDRDYRTGARFYTIELDEEASDVLEVDSRESLVAVASNGYFGAVFLTSAGAPDLQSLVNREGFVPGPTLDEIRRIVQDGVRLSVRIRRSIHNQRLLATSEPEAIEPSSPPSIGPETLKGPPGPPPLPFNTLSRKGPTRQGTATIDLAAAAATHLTEAFRSGGDPATTDVRALVDGFQVAREALVAVQNIQPELRTLAGVGLQLGAFVHDINGMLSATATIRELLRRLRDAAIDPTLRSDLRVILSTADELAHTLARQSSYLADVLTSDPRRRRSPVKLADRVDSVLRFLAGRIAERGIRIHLDVPDTVRTAPMFPAEVMILMTNLLTNAIKNAADDGDVWIEAEEDELGVTLTISNDGAVVDLAEAERWFLPFESTTVGVDEVLGQGLGLGLPIVRALVTDYRGDVRFVPSRHGLGTSIQVVLPKKGANDK